MPAADVVARVHTTLAHVAPEGRLPQRLERSASSCGELRIENAPFEMKVWGYTGGEVEEDYQREARQT